jgi:hypothetical protein
MSEVRSIDKNEDHDKTIKNTSDIITLKSDEKNRSDLDTVIKEVKQEFRNLLIKRKELITRLGNAFGAVLSNPEDVCEEIKNSLQEEIADKIISARDIERYCPDKWKKKTKPKNDNLSFSKQVEEKPQQQIATTQDGKSVIVNETSSNPSKQDGISVDDNNEAQTTVPNQGELVSYNEPKDNTVSVGDSPSSDVVQPHQEHSQNDQREKAMPANHHKIKQLQRELYERTQELVDKISQNVKLSEELRHFKELRTLQKDDASNNLVQKLVSHPSDKQIDGLEEQTLKRTSVQAPSEFEFTIPKEKYRMVRNAMDKSKASIFVKFDRNNRFLSADPDVYNEIPFDISGANHQDGNVQRRQSDDVAKDEEQTESSETDEKQKAENLAQIGYSNHAFS